MEQIGAWYRVLGTLGWIVSLGVVAWLIVSGRDITTIHVVLVVVVAMLSLGLFRPKWFGDFVTQLAAAWPLGKEK
jgi:hypothetical protein